MTGHNSVGNGQHILRIVLRNPDCSIRRKSFPKYREIELLPALLTSGNADSGTGMAFSSGALKEHF
jgi:hypothetical protein